MDAVSLGERLREVRRRQGWSLHDVEERSGLEFKASVLGAYERGERAISTARLMRLASIYGMSATELLPVHERAADIDLTREDGAVTLGWTLDLSRLESLTDMGDPTIEVVSRFATEISRARRDLGEGALTLREGDVWAISTALGTDRTALLTLLQAFGACAVDQR